MARSHARFAQLYVGVTSAGAAQPLLYAAQTDLSLSTGKVDVTAFGDTNLTYVAGLPDGQGTFSGFASDAASTSLVTAALDGVARKWYFYPFNNNTTYFYGTGFFDWKTTTAVAAAVAMSGTFAAASPIGTIGF